ncbi:hypothetical protein AB0F17_08420 [Nonomuraea sp. NPDC026600]|uniref:hypothetical protein n=1 Tax=Nonomuraea sp. NPDC026600 TaxID=3155363 RepID=UPI0033F1572F
MSDDLRQRARDWITGFLAASDEDRVNCVALMLGAADDALACVTDRHRARLAGEDDEELSELREEVAFEKHRSTTFLADYNFLDFQFKAQARELARLKAEGARDV